jgi:glycolate oxidase FAD binding subunit
VALRLEGLAASVRTRVAGLLAALARTPQALLEAGAAREFWRQVGAVEALSGFPVIWRLSVAPSRAARLLEAIEPEAFQLDWGGGLIWVGAHHVDAARIRAALHGGHATLIRAPVAQRRATAVFEPQTPAVAAIAARLKAAFDPDHRLNPGRMS